MAIVCLVIAWALVGAIVAVARAARPGLGGDPPSMLSGLVDGRL